MSARKRTLRLQTEGPFLLASLRWGLYIRHRSADDPFDGLLKSKTEQIAGKVTFSRIACDANDDLIRRKLLRHFDGSIAGRA